MIEKIMKAVKSGNKKRGRNITIGAVVGMLLSCTVAMGEETTDTDLVGLNITNDASGIKIDKVFPDNTLKGNTYTNNTEILGESSTGTEEGIGVKIDGENKKTNLTLKNNGVISGKSSVGKAYGIKVGNLGENSKFNFINNGEVSGEYSINTGSKSGYGFYISGDKDKNIDFSFQNNGLISGKSASIGGVGVYIDELKTAGSFINNGVILGETSKFSSGSGYGVYSVYLSGDGFTLENNGLISGKSLNKSGYGVHINGISGDNITLENNGTILGEGATGNSDNVGYGIYLTSISGSGFTLENNGLISAKGYTSYGIYVCSSKINIETLTNNGLILSFGDNTSSGYGICTGSSDNISSITTLENNGLILTSSSGVVLGVEKGDAETLINNGSILTGGSGISISGAINGDTASISNNGILSTKNSTKECRGINIWRGNGTNDRVGTLTNDGLISAKGSVDSSGIKVSSSGKTGNIISNGLILSNGMGIRSTDANKGKIGNIVNNGAISAEKYGIATDPTSNNGGLIDKIVNTGVVYGKTNAIKKEAGTTGKEGEIKDATNYGILVNGSTNNVFDVSGKTLDNYGLTIKDANGSAEVTVEAKTPVTGPVDVIVGYKRTFDNEGNAKDTEIKRKLTIKNAEITGVTSETSEGIITGTGTKSFTFSDDGTEYDNSILNGMDDTLEISGADVKREVKGSIINAYGNAIKFGEVGKEFTLSGTIVNGGIKKGTVAIKGSNGADTLILQSGKVEYSDKTTGSQNTIVNGDIDMGDGEDSITLKTDTIVNGNITTGKDNDTLIIESGAVSNGNIVMGDGDDTLTIGSGAVINGTLNGGTDITVIALDLDSKSNTLNFVTADSSSSEETRIFYDISNFENININENTSVTFFENVKVKGVDTLTIAETGVLNLRLKDSGTKVDVGGDMVSKAEHAFLGNEMIIQGEGNGIDIAGTMNFVTNGIGRRIYVDMTDIELKNLYIKTSSIIDGYKITEKESLILGAYGNLEEIYRPEDTREKDLSKKRYESLNNIYKGIYSSKDENLNALRTLISFNNFGNNYEENMSDEEQLKNLMSYLNSIYTESPYSFSSELSRRSAGMFRDIVTENEFRPNLNNWLIMGGLTHADGGTKDTYYGRNYHEFDTGTSDTNADMKLTGAYMLAKYGYSENTSLGLTLGGNKSEAKMDMSKVKGNSGYLGVFAENYRGNLTLKAGAGIQYSEYDADRRTIGGHSYNDKYSDMTYDIYLNGRYSHQVGDNLFLEPYATLSYTYVDQDGADEGSKVLAIETDSKSFDYTVGKVGVDLKKVIPHEKGKSTLSAGVSYTKILDGADEEHITGRFKGGSDFDILVAHKNEHSIGLNAKYALELENGVIFDVKGTYSVERDSHNQSGKNRTKGEWIVGAGIGYKF